jgi:hypothetical protein
MNINPFSHQNREEKKHPNDSRTAKERQVESLWATYSTLCLLEANPDANSALQSPEAQAANIRQLATLRRLFWDVPESAGGVDPARPKTLAECDKACEDGLARLAAQQAARSGLAAPTRVTIVPSAEMAKA